MSAFEQQMKEGAIYHLLNIYKGRLKFAQSGIVKMLDLSSKLYLSLSFGKQSVCLAHLLYQANPDVPAFFLASSETWKMHNYLEVIDDFLKICPLNLTIVQTNRLGWDISESITELKRRQPKITWIFRGWGEAENWKEGRDAGDKDLQQMTNRGDWDGWFWGLAKEESKQREYTLSLRWPGQPHPSIFRYNDDKYRCCPLMDWGLKEIAAYVGEHNLPLLDIYKKAGLQARTTARLTKKAAVWGGLSDMKRLDLSTYNQLCAEFPELRGVDQHQ